MKLSIGWFKVNKELEVINLQLSKMNKECGKSLPSFGIILKKNYPTVRQQGFVSFLHYDTVISSGLLLMITFLL